MVSMAGLPRRNYLAVGRQVFLQLFTITGADLRDAVDS